MAADAPQATSELLVGRRLGLYTITRCVGKGGMGQVYEALHEAPHEVDAQRVAVKVLNDALFKDEKILRRFFNEAKALSIVQHQSIVKVFEFGQLDDGTPYILMEFLAGEPLLDYMLRGQRQGQGLALVVVLELGRQLAAALTASHEKGVIHRDLKPENIFVIPDAAAPLGERVKLLDFGIAKFLEGPTRKTTIGTILGTPLYMSPEQCEGSQDLDAKVDVYALGVLLYEMLTGHLPFMADTTAAIMRQHIFKAPPPLAVQAARVPAEIAGLVHRMLAKPPAERPAMTAVHAALDGFLSQAADMQSGPRQALALQLAAHRQPGVVVGGAAADPRAATIGGAGSGEPPRADSAEQSAAPRPVSSLPESAQGSRRRALLAGALLILVLALALAAVSRRPGD
ncbi:MAG TPA: protein kinase, partial [Pseudomonadota bacterium]|nr:protein kinase [Pseudomonadota bacterium]